MARDLICARAAQSVGEFSRSIPPSTVEPIAGCRLVVRDSLAVLSSRRIASCHTEEHFATAVRLQASAIAAMDTGILSEKIFIPASEMSAGCNDGDTDILVDIACRERLWHDGYRLTPLFAADALFAGPPEWCRRRRGQRHAGSEARAVAPFASPPPAQFLEPAF